MSVYKSVYELVFLVGSDLSSTKVDDIVGNLTESLQKNGHSVLLKEYWGIRELAYNINKRNRAHYYYLAMQFKDKEKKAKWLQTDFKKLISSNHIVMRHMFSEAKFFRNEPSPILKQNTSLHDDDMDIVDVTNFGASGPKVSENSRDIDIQEESTSSFVSEN